MSEQGPVVPWELARLEKRRELREGEVVREAQEAWTRFSRSRGRVGALVLTNARLLFVSTGVITRRIRFFEIPLEAIEAVEVVDSPRWGEERGALAVDTTGGEEPRRLEFERIAGGRERAAQLAEAIRREQQLAQGPS
jgi:hypothetical protein